jgi:DNA-directed RNA polymerase subunit M/transcription elongation factor TFIIS
MDVVFPLILFGLFLPMMIGVMLVGSKQRNRSKQPLEPIQKRSDAEKRRQEKIVNNYNEDKNVENYALSQKEFDLIVQQLERKEVKSICPMCGCDELSLSKFFGFTRYFIRIQDFVETNDGLPTIIIACQRCGFLWSMPSTLLI